MQYVSYHDSPLGRLLLAADSEGLIGLWFEGQKYYARGLKAEHELLDIVNADGDRKKDNVSAENGAKDELTGRTEESHRKRPADKLKESTERKPEGSSKAWPENMPMENAEERPENRSKAIKTLSDAGRWLDSYFLGKEPDISVPLHLIGTEFQREVWKELLLINYGETRSYGEIAESIAKRRGLDKLSARAVGSAVGHNPISLIVPCHRVVGSDGSLTGYAGGIERKQRLLSLEQGLGPL